MHEAFSDLSRVPTEDGGATASESLYELTSSRTDVRKTSLRVFPTKQDVSEPNVEDDDPASWRGDAGRFVGESGGTPPTIMVQTWEEDSQHQLRRMDSRPDTTP